MFAKITLIPTFNCMFAKTTFIPTFCRMFAKITRIPQVLIRTHVCDFYSSCAGRQPFRGRYVAHTKGDSRKGRFLIVAAPEAPIGGHLYWQQVGVKVILASMQQKAGISVSALCVYSVCALCALCVHYVCTMYARC